MPKFNQDTIFETLDRFYDLARKGAPGSKPLLELKRNYQGSEEERKDFIRKFILKESALNFGSTFTASFGGIFTLPVSMPLELSASLYLQLRMNGLIALIAGYDLDDEKVKSLIYCCLVGKSGWEIMNEAGLDKKQKISQSYLATIGKTTIKKLNKALALKLISKLGTKSIGLVGRWIPVLSGIFGGGADAYTCFKSGKMAETIFLGEYYK